MSPITASVHMAGRATRRAPLTPVTMFGSSVTGWWRASDHSGLADGTAIPQWDDRSKNANHVTQATGSRQPTKQTDVSGLPCVRFASASQQVMQCASPAGFPAAPNAFTVMAVVRSSTAVKGALMEYAAATNKGHALTLTATPNVESFTATRSGTGTATVSDGALHLVQWSFESSNATLYVNNRIPAAAGSITLASGANLLAIGGSLLYNQWYANFDVYEIVVFDRVLTAVERDAISRTYFARRYSKLVGNRYNATAPLTTPTYDGSGQATHPDVYVSPTTWNGYKYWMAMTPYPGADATKENPSVIVSNDNTTWVEPPGITNPIEPAPGGGTTYNSDVDMFLDPAGVTMGMIWRFVGTAEDLYMKTSTDGITWSAKTLVASSTSAPLAATVQQRALSPTVVYFGGKYWMWTVRTNVASPIGRVVDYWQAATMTGGFTYMGITSLTCPSTQNSGDAAPWHIDVELFGGKLYMLVNDRKNLFLAKSDDGINWITSPTPIMIPGTNWDQTFIYRSSMSISGDGQTLMIWYGGVSGSTWKVGYAGVPASELLTF